MLRSGFTEEQDAFRAPYRRFLQREVTPHCDEWQKAGIVPRKMFRIMGEQGYLLIWADEGVGGLGLDDFRFQQIMIEEDAAYGDVGFLPRCIAGDHILAIAMTEPGIGSDLAGMQTHAEDCGEHWMLNGAKTFISNGINADLVVTAAKTNATQPREMGLFVVEATMSGFERGRPLAKLGLKAQDTSELFFRDVKVPKCNVLGDPSKGLGYLMQGLPEERLIGAVQYLANAQCAFSITREFVTQRRSFGKPLSAMQNTRFKMAALRTELDIAQVFVDHCVRVHNQERLSTVLAAKAKLFTSELEGRVVDECLQLHGGAGDMEEYEICRRYADARVSRIYAGSSEIMREIVARSIFD